MDLEHEALIKQRPWVLAPQPANTNVITCRCVFTLKYNLDKTIHQHKALLVACGFSQTYVIDYKETFSPMVYLNSVCIILSLVVNHELSIHQLDVSNAFLYGVLTEHVFMEQSLGYAVQT